MRRLLSIRRLYYEFRERSPTTQMTYTSVKASSDLVTGSRITSMKSLHWSAVYGNVPTDEVK